MRRLLACGMASAMIALPLGGCAGGAAAPAGKDADATQEVKADSPAGDDLIRDVPEPPPAMRVYQPDPTEEDK